MNRDAEGCRACEASVRLAKGEVERILTAYLVDHPDAPLVDDATYAHRLAECHSCRDLQYGGTTCRHCGCLVAVRAKLAEKACPAVPARWQSVSLRELLNASSH